MGDFWVATQQVLQGDTDPIVEKPKLTQKLLERPPFRFLHDVISAVNAKTGFAPGLFTAEEMDAKALAEKDQKIAYLQKIMDVVGIVLGEPVDAKPAKRVLGGEHAAGAAAEPKKEHKSKKDKKKDEAGEGSADTAAEKPKSKSKSKPKAEEPPAESAPPPPPKKKSEKKPEAEERPRPSIVDENGEADYVTQAREQAAENESAQMARPMSARARKPPPKLPPSEANKGGLRPPAGTRPGTASMRPGTAAMRPGTAAARAVAVFQDKEADDDDEVEVTVEQAPRHANVLNLDGDGADAGVLVKDILEAEKNLKKEAAADEIPMEDQGPGIILSRGKKAAAGAAPLKPGDLVAVREMVQNLCSTTQPLAKTMDYLSEDMDAMGKEYRFWTAEKRVYQDRLAEEMRLVADLSSGEQRLEELDGQIRQVRDRIIGCKAAVLRNDETISKLLAMAVSGNR